MGVARRWFNVSATNAAVDMDQQRPRSLLPISDRGLNRRCRTIRMPDAQY